MLTCYLPIGDPELPTELADIYADCGVDIFEVGVPSSDPWMDGPSVANSMQRTLAAGIDKAFIGKTLAEFNLRFKQQAIVLMGYPDIDLDSILNEHYPVFDALICVGADAEELLKSVSVPVSLGDVAPISFVPFDMPAETLDYARKANGGYVMLQASPGKTGTRSELDSSLSEKIAMLRDAGVSIPILPGFGISTPEHAAVAIQAGADGVIIGSACLEHAQRGEQEIRRFLAEVRSAIDV